MKEKKIEEAGKEASEVAAESWVLCSARRAKAGGGFQGPWQLQAGASARPSRELPVFKPICIVVFRADTWFLPFTSFSQLSFGQPLLSS